jgi:hypothetical protein
MWLVWAWELCWYPGSVAAFTANMITLLQEEYLAKYIILIKFATIIKHICCNCISSLVVDYIFALRLLNINSILNMAQGHDGRTKSCDFLSHLVWYKLHDLLLLICNTRMGMGAFTKNCYGGIQANIKYLVLMGMIILVIKNCVKRAWQVW